MFNQLIVYTGYQELIRVKKFIYIYIFFLGLLFTTYAVHSPLYFMPFISCFIMFLWILLNIFPLLLDFLDTLYDGKLAR